MNSWRTADQAISNPDQRPEPQLVGGHRRRRGAVGEQVALAFLDPVLLIAVELVQAEAEASASGKPARRFKNFRTARSDWRWSGAGRANNRRLGMMFLDQNGVGTARAVRI